MSVKRFDITAYVDANAREFHQAMRNIRGDSAKTGRAFKAEIAAMSARLRGMVNPALAIAATLTATATVAATTARAVADIGREARRSGLGVEQFQELAFVAEQSRIPVDSLIDGMKELSLRADEFIVTGGGPAAEAFARLGFDADDLAERLEEPNKLFIEIIGRMEELDRAAQIRIADELFGGTAGERFVELLDSGAAGIEEQIRLANDLGIVLDEGVIAKAEEIDRKFAIVAQTIGGQVKGAIVSAATALMGFIDEFRDLESRSTAVLGRQLVAIERDRLTLENDLRNLQKMREGSGIGSMGLQPQIDSTVAEIEQLVARGDRIAALLNRTRDMPQDSSGRSGRLFQDAEGQAGIQMRIDSAFDVRPASTSSRDAADRDRAAKAAERERQAVVDLIDSLQFEYDLIGKSAVEREKAIRLREAGAAATPKQRAEIEALVDAIAAETEELERNKLAAERRAEAWEWGFDTVNSALEQMVLNGDSAEDAMRRLAIALAMAVAQAALLNSGPLAGAIPSLFPAADGAAFRGGAVTALARGGVVNGPTLFPMAQGMGLMGEAGPEAVMPLTRLSDGRLGVEATGAVAAPATGDIHVHYHANQQFRGTEQEFRAFERQMETEFRRVREEVPDLVQQARRDRRLR